MRKATVCSMVALFALGSTIGIVIAFTENAMAIPECSYECEGYYDCTFDTGPNCTNPSFPYYVYFHPTCGGGPLSCPSGNYFVYCWDGVRCPTPVPAEPL